MAGADSTLGIDQQLAGSVESALSDAVVWRMSSCVMGEWNPHTREVVPFKRQTWIRAGQMLLVPRDRGIGLRGALAIKGEPVPSGWRYAAKHAIAADYRLVSDACASGSAMQMRVEQMVKENPNYIGDLELLPHPNGRSLSGTFRSCDTAPRPFAASVVFSQITPRG